MYTSVTNRQDDLTENSVSVELIDDKVHVHLGSRYSTYLALSVDEAKLIAKKIAEALPVGVWV